MAAMTMAAAMAGGKKKGAGRRAGIWLVRLVAALLALLLAAVLLSLLALLKRPRWGLHRQAEQGTGSGFIYVYDLPARFNEELLDDDPLWAWNGGPHATEAAVHRLLARSNALRTTDPDRAALFLVPVYSARFLALQGNDSIRAAHHAAQFVEAALRHVQRAYPFWRRSNGRDHFVVTSHDYGRCSVLGLCSHDAVGEMFSLQLFGEPSLEGLQSSLTNEKNALDSKPGQATRTCTLERDIAIPAFSLPSAKQLSAMVERSEDVLLIEDGKPPDPEAVRRARVCVVGAGGAALSAALAGGCVPVSAFSKHALRPWEASLAYSSFSLNVDPDSVGASSLAERAAAIARDPERLRRMQRALANVQKWFTYKGTTSDGGSALTLLGDALRVRAQESSFSRPLASVRLQAALSRALSEEGARLQLCAPPLSPFVAGTYHKDSQEAQLIVFEAELLRGIAPGKSSAGKPDDLVVQLLAFAEDEESITRSAKSWGGAWLSSLAEKRGLHLRCEFWAGHGRGAQRESSPLLVTDAIIAEHTQEYSLLLHCPLPSPENLPPLLLSAPKLQIQLVASDPSDLLHMPPLPLCRTDMAVQERAPSPPPEGDPEVGVCLYPYRDHRPFSIEDRLRGDRTENLFEWIDYNLLMGVSRIFFYDRYGDEKLPLLRPYVDRGVVVHVPFPTWSEVFFRRNIHANANDRYVFPQSYDQILANEHCMMQGRRHNLSWLLFIDIDEFISLGDARPGSLPRAMKEAEARHRGDLPLAVLRVKRFNFLGASEKPTTVLKNVTQRCSQPMQHGWRDWSGNLHVDSHDKLAARPNRMIGSKVEIHFTKQTSAQAIGSADVSSLKIHHYASTPLSEYKETGVNNFVFCPKVGTEENVPVEDPSLVWAARRITECKASPGCSEGTGDAADCGKLCSTLAPLQSG